MVDADLLRDRLDPVHRHAERLPRDDAVARVPLARASVARTLEEVQRFPGVQSDPATRSRRSNDASRPSFMPVCAAASRASFDGYVMVSVIVVFPPDSVRTSAL